MPVALFVRIKSGLDPEEFGVSLAGTSASLSSGAKPIQKIYGRDSDTGEVCGIYLFETQEALGAFRETELARRIPSDYDAVDVRRDVYDVLYPLWSERGPFTASTEEPVAR